MVKKTKIAFLYSEIAGYTVACINELAKEADVLLFRWPVNAEAPFNFTFHNNVKVIDRNGYSVDDIREELEIFNPELIVTSGWMDKGYLKALKKLKLKIPKVVVIDNHWVGNTRQRIATLASPFYLKKIFTHVWVPGDPQFKFAIKLGFKSSRIMKGFYCADTDLFAKIYENTFAEKVKRFPKRILYVARYVEHKGIFEMWKAFLKWKKETNSDWELWCVGAGEEWDNKIEGDGIRHFGFLQPTEMEALIEQTGVYILPSKFEPWGVSVQEFAIAGFPLLLSEQIGAGSKFCESENGLKFQSGSEVEILKVFQRIERLTNDELIKMGQKSHEIGMTNTPSIWTKKLLSIKLDDGKTRY